MDKKINADDVLELLLKRHEKDICVAECKHGRSWTSEKVKRFDLWVMKKSYTSPMSWIYEIKVSRQDFLQDQKWQTYLPFCSDFYFVAPVGTIDVSEVPEQAGLLLSTKNGTKLYCKKKAPHRCIEMPPSVYEYILMSRVRIVDSTYTNNGKNNQAYWQQWLDNKSKNQKLGFNVSRKIRQLYDKNVQFVEMKQDQFEIRIEKLENAKAILRQLGFDGEKLPWNYEEKIRERVAEINEGFPEKSVTKYLESAIENLQNIIKTIKESNSNG